MSTEVRAVIARARPHPSRSPRSSSRIRGRARRWSASRPAGFATPICATREGGVRQDFPYLLGHEAAGVVEAVATPSPRSSRATFVILNWRAVCGQCRACLRGDRGNASTRTTRSRR